MKLGTNIHHVSGYRRKDFKVTGSKVKVTLYKCVNAITAEEYISSYQCSVARPYLFVLEPRVI